MTSGRSGVQGGRYEGVGQWCWQTFSITSAWGFRANDFTTISEPVSAEKYSPLGGRHAKYEAR